MTEAELIQQLAATTGPIGTMLAIGFMWARGRFNAIDARDEVQDKRIEKLEDAA